MYFVGKRFPICCFIANLQPSASIAGHIHGKRGSFKGSDYLAY